MSERACDSRSNTHSMTLLTSGHVSELRDPLLIQAKVRLRSKRTFDTWGAYGSPTTRGRKPREPTMQQNARPCRQTRLANPPYRRAAVRTGAETKIGTDDAMSVFGRSR